MGHYVLGHAIQRVLVTSAVLVIMLFAVNATGLGIIRKCGSRFGFDQLADIASLPLLVLLVNLFSLAAAPIALAHSRYLEREADRFALELTQDNHAAASQIVKLQQRNLGIPRPPWVPFWWRATHPSLGDKLDFANEYRPWGVRCADAVRRSLQVRGRTCDPAAATIGAFADVFQREADSTGRD